MTSTEAEGMAIAAEEAAQRSHARLLGREVPIDVSQLLRHPDRAHDADVDLVAEALVTLRDLARAYLATGAPGRRERALVTRHMHNREVELLAALRRRGLRRAIRLAAGTPWRLGLAAAGVRRAARSSPATAGLVRRIRR